MGIFADECDRCGQKTRNKLNDKPICPSCEQEMATLMEASTEGMRACPVDGSKMSKSIAHMVVIDRCPECGGVWLDGGELERLYTDASDEALVQMARAIWV
jgi:Transcription factor zinc-finger